MPSLRSALRALPTLAPAAFVRDRRVAHLAGTIVEHVERAQHRAAGTTRAPHTARIALKRRVLHDSGLISLDVERIAARVADVYRHTLTDRGIARAWRTQVHLALSDSAADGIEVQLEDGVASASPSTETLPLPECVADREVTERARVALVRDGSVVHTVTIDTGAHAVVGRGADATVRATHRSVSRHAAVLRFEHGSLTIVLHDDCSLKSPVSRNGAPLSRGAAVELVLGDEVVVSPSESLVFTALLGA